LAIWRNFYFSNGDHLGYRTALTDTILKGDHPRIIRWPPLLKIEISSNGQNSSILSQKVPKFEMYKHNDELFNIYYGIFYVWLYLYEVQFKLEFRSGRMIFGWAMALELVFFVQILRFLDLFWKSTDNLKFEQKI
jgi:hypothetical protein